MKNFFRLLVVALLFTGAQSCLNEDNKIIETCFDETQNQGETGIDCGGPCPICPPSCSDGIRNGEEEQIDCGGPDCEPCASCDDGIQNAHWKYDPNLEDSVLIMELGIDCGFPCLQACPPTCDDGIWNGDEEGIDCGDSCQEPCDVNTCSDGIHNGSETGIDCGPGCDGVDGEGGCAPPSCDDGIQNSYIVLSDDEDGGYEYIVETGIDCDQNGQTECPGDCPNPTCWDGIQNGSELGVDCGGSCGTACPTEGSCSNGIQDGTEAGVDCDFDDSTLCPDCPTCGNGVQDGPENGIDCTLLALDDYPCDSICATCDNGVYEPGEPLYEVQTDCGGTCEPCDQIVLATIEGEGQFRAGGENGGMVVVTTGAQNTLRIEATEVVELSSGETFTRQLIITIPNFPALDVDDYALSTVPSGITNPAIGSLEYISFQGDNYGLSGETFSEPLSIVNIIEPPFPVPNYGQITGEIETINLNLLPIDPNNPQFVEISGLTFQINTP